MKVYFIRSIFQDIVSMDTVIMKIMVSTWQTFLYFEDTYSRTVLPTKSKS